VSVTSFQNLFSTIASNSDLRPADLEIAANLAGKSQWQLSAVDVGSGSDHAQGLLDALAYYDKLLFHDWHLPATNYPQFLCRIFFIYRLPVDLNRWWLRWPGIPRISPGNRAFISKRT
jgi:hypothetical protein